MTKLFAGSAKNITARATSSLRPSRLTGMAAAQKLEGRSDAAEWVRRLREAALKDEDGVALAGALKTVDSFLH